jgi:uncharacterized protein (UPF0210 family)
MKERFYSMPSVPIRTITLGIGEAHPLSAATIERAAGMLARARERFSAEGYEVQTVRLATHPLFEDLVSWSSGSILRYTRDLQKMLEDKGLAYCSLGPAQATRMDFPLEWLDLLTDILIAAPALNATVQFADRVDEHDVLREEAAQPTAHVIQRLAKETEEGAGNFRFAMLARVASGTPFFPAAYHTGSTTEFALGLQGASLITDTLREHQETPSKTLNLAQVTRWLQDALASRTAVYQSIAHTIAQEEGLVYRGIDYSPAPMSDDSIVTALELCGYGPIGSPGTLAVIAAQTAALKRLGGSAPGYNGVMLPVLEDAVLGQRWAEGLVNIQQLLLYSSVCGTGLDTIPLAGDTPDEAIAHLLLDVATLALRLCKPLSVRLFPVCGQRDGEYTNFSSPYLTNTIVRSLVS